MLMQMVVTETWYERCYNFGRVGTMKFDIHAYSKFSAFDDAIKIKFKISLKCLWCFEHTINLE